MLNLDKTNKYIYYFAFLVIVIIAFWQIAAGLHPVKYDMVDCYFPWRYFIGENLQSGQLPLWNPYQNLGSPIQADPSSGIWYPPVWFLGSIFGYSLRIMGIEFLLHVLLAGVGFYKLCKTLKLENHTAFIAGACYMLCGLFVGNAQHLTYIVSACWLPYLINYYIRITEEGSYSNCIKAALCLFLMITGGYPAFTIISFYLLLTFFIYHLVRSIRAKDKPWARLFVYRNLVFGGLTLILSAVMLVAILQVSPYITRTNLFGLKEALFCPFSPQSFISFLMPFASVKNMEFFATDMSMSNAYFGLLMFVFFLLSLKVKKPITYKILFWFAVFSLTAAVGDYLPIRSILFKVVPLMDLFRFPSVFRLFVIIGFLLSAALWLDSFIKDCSEEKIKMLKKVALISILVFLVVFLAAYFTDRLWIRDFLKKRIFIVANSTSLANHIAFQAGIQLMAMGTLLFILIKVKQRQQLILCITLLIIADLVFATRLNTPYTAYYDAFSASASDKHIKRMPEGFPMPKDMAVSELKQDSVNSGPFWKNLNIFQKQVSREGFNSFKISDYEKLRDETPRIFNAITSNRIVYLSDKPVSEKEMAKLEKDSSFSADMVYFKEADLEKLKGQAMKHESGDTAWLAEFSPKKFVVKTNTKAPQLLSLLQNDYTGWEVLVNDKPIEHYTANSSLIAAQIPAGSNTVSFVYDNKTLRIAFYLSALTFLLACLFLLREWWKKPREVKITLKDIYYWIMT